MKRILILIVCILTCLQGLVINTMEVEASGADAVNASNKKPTGGKLYEVDYYRNNMETYLSEASIVYDSKGRVFNDGLFYHLYDKKGNEIDIGVPTNYYPGYGIRSDWYTVEVKRDGTGAPVSATIKQDRTNTIKANMKFIYNKDGTVDEIQFSGNDFGSPYTGWTSFTYDSKGKLTSTHKEEHFEYSSWKCDDVYSYSGDGVSKIETSFSRGEKGKEPNYFTKYITTYKYSGAKVSHVDFVSKSQYGEYTEGEYTFKYNGSSIESFEYKYSGKGYDGRKVYYSYDPVKPAIMSIYPPTGQQGNFPNTIKITFGNRNIIEKINKNSANIYICDSETGKVVYAAGKGEDVRSKGNLLYFKNNTFIWTILQSNSPFEDGHSYYLKMDEDFIKFKDSDEKIGISDSDLWIHYMPDAKKNEGPLNKRITFNFTGSEGDNFSTYADYNELCFEHSSYQYDDELATTSLCMAMASYNTHDITRGYENIADFLDQLEFKNIYVNSDYRHSTQHDTTGVLIGSKELRDGTTLVAVAVRSGNYNNEWGGNFNVGESGDHAGFTIGKNNVIRELQHYFSSEGQGRDIKGKIKIWIAGYSRGSAIVNLTAAALDDGINLGSNVSYDPAGVYAYCFEVPNTTVSADAHSGLYGNIYCIINPNDIVTRLPLSQWGFTHYGNELMIPSQDTNSSAFKRYYNKVFSMFMSQFYHSGIDTVYVDNEYYLINGVMEWVNRDVLSLATVGSDIYYGDVNLFRKARGKYVSVLQNLLIRKAPEIMAKQETGELKTEDPILTQFIDFIKEETLSFLARITVKQRIKKLAIDVCGASSIKLSQIDKLLEVALYSHYTELTLCWMRNLEYTGVLNRNIVSSDYDAYSTDARVNKVTFHCPVDVVAYDSDGNVIIEIRSGKVTSEQDTSLTAYYGEDGSKTFIIPEFMNVSFEIIPYDNGEMSVTTEVINIVTGRREKADIIMDVPVAKNESMRYNIDTGLSCDDYTSELVSYDGDEIPVTNEVFYEEEGYCLATVNVEGEGEAYGDGIVDMNTFHLFIAEPRDKQVFAGWYDENGELISDNAYYSVFMDKDITMTARFEKKKTIVPIVLGVAGVAVIGAAVVLLRKKKQK